MSSPIVKRFLKRKASIAGLAVLTIFFLMAIIGPSLCTYDPLAQDIKNMSQGPSAAHWFGTDYLGRDTFTRIVYGARMSLFACSPDAWWVCCWACVRATMAAGSMR